ncbi:hypothetical protein [Streptomonospora arabica]|uniref:Uncharacterized protein n=1 Tax=Streptomonospora arabica TaxID=412417 RepID=A0ABV9SGX3_9ACTN
MWPLDRPPYDHRDWWVRKAAAWVSRLLPPEAGQAVPELHVRPRAAGRVAWRWMHASLNARGRDLGTLSMSSVISREQLDGILPDTDIDQLRALDGGGRHDHAAGGHRAPAGGAACGRDDAAPEVASMIRCAGLRAYRYT